MDFKLIEISYGDFLTRASFIKNEFKWQLAQTIKPLKMFNA